MSLYFNNKLLKLDHLNKQKALNQKLHHTIKIFL